MRGEGERGGGVKRDGAGNGQWTWTQTCVSTTQLLVFFFGKVQTNCKRRLYSSNFLSNVGLAYNCFAAKVVLKLKTNKI